MDKKKIFIIVWVILLCLSVVYFINKKENENNDDVVIQNGNIVVSDYSLFYTIDGCANKYISYLNSNNATNLVKVLNEEYKISNNITSNNVLEKLVGFNGKKYNFQSKKIYRVDLTERITKYYVYGYLNEQKMDSFGKSEDYYLIVTIDDENSLFSITPYDGKIFKEGDM